MAYATIEDLKAYLKISSTDDDMLLGALLDRATAIIESPLGADRKFEARADTTRYFNSDEDVDGPFLYLDEDLCAITSITNGDADVLTTAEYTTVPKNDTPYYAIKLLGSSGLAWEAKSTTDDPENAITIVGRWSYSTTPPTAIKFATIRLGAWLYRQKDTSIDLERPFIAEGGVTIMPSAFPKDVMDILYSFRRLVLI
jgi:hypothetical protein